MNIEDYLRKEIVSQIQEKGFSKKIEKELIEKITTICSAYRTDRRMNETSLKQMIEKIGELIDG